MKSKTYRFPAPQIDIRSFRLKRINEPEYRHMWLLLFWPVFAFRYLLIERIDPIGQYHLIHCALDDRIPFQELFLIPYALWYVCIIGMHLYTMVYAVAAFKKYTKFLVISITASTTIFILYPSYQELRPVVFPRDNVLIDIVGMIYQIDTNTNIFPSEHAIGAIAVFCVSCHTKGLPSPLKTTMIGILTVLICLSTVFLKQHSILDVAAALPVCVVAYAACYGKEKIRKRQAKVKYAC